jgi:predicted lipase
MDVKKIILFLIFLISISTIYLLSLPINKKSKSKQTNLTLNNQIIKPTKSNFLNLLNLINNVYNFSPDKKMNNPLTQENIDKENNKLATDFINQNFYKRGTIRLIEGQENFFGRYYTSIFGTIGIDKNNDDTAIMAFRGTTTKSDWLADVFANFNELNEIIAGINKNIKVAHGFGSLFGIFKGVTNVTMDKQIDNWLNLNNVKNIIITGHSLGGTLAILSAVYIKSKYPALNVTVYTYASPKVGNNEFYNYYTQLGLDKSSFRFFSSHDVVPTLPPQLLGYKHVGIDYELTDKKPPIPLCSKISDVYYYHVAIYFDKDCSDINKWLDLIN